MPMLLACVAQLKLAAIGALKLRAGPQFALFKFQAHAHSAILNVFLSRGAGLQLGSQVHINWPSDIGKCLDVATGHSIIHEPDYSSRLEDTERVIASLSATP